MLNVKIQPTGHLQLLEFVVTVNKNKALVVLSVASVAGSAYYAWKTKKEASAC